MAMNKRAASGFLHEPQFILNTTPELSHDAPTTWSLNQGVSNREATVMGSVSLRNISSRISGAKAEGQVPAT